MYEKLISSKSPGLIVLVLDDSDSMAEMLPGTSDPKFMWVERYAGHILRELYFRSSVAAGDSTRIKPRYFVYVILYGGTHQVWSGGELDIESAVRTFSASGNSFGLGGKLGATDSAGALMAAHDYVAQAVQSAQFCSAFPPIVFHLTDGESQTDPIEAGRRLMTLRTPDGLVLVANAFIGANTSLSYSGPSDFPGYMTADEAGPSDYSRALFEISSEIPVCMRQNLIADAIFPVIRPGARLYWDIRSREGLKHCIQAVGSGGSRAASMTNSVLVG